MTTTPIQTADALPASAATSASSRATRDPVTAARLPRTPRPARRRSRIAPALLAGTAVILGLTLVAIFVPMLSPYSPTEMAGIPFENPSGAHLLGTDNLGRDLLTRIAVAARYGLLVSAGATVIAAVLGTAGGMIAGYFGGVTDAVIMRSVEVLLAIPAILMALLVRVVVGPGLIPLAITLGAISAPGFARIMRAPALVLRDRDFVVAAQVSGVRTWKILLRHLVPNALTPLLVQSAATASQMVLLESVLSYLGQGIQAPEPSGGRMISESLRFMQTAPLVIIVPAALIVALTIGWNLVADGLQRQVSPQSGQPKVALSRAPRITRTASAAGNA